MAYQTPKTNWLASDVVQPADMNRIEQNIVELKKAATIDVADANGYFTTTPKTAESALQELGSAVTTGKSKIATAISAMNQAASSTDTYDTLAAKIRAISTDATAGTGDVLSGKTFYQGGSKKTGTMANRGAVVITPGTSNQTIAAGYHNGSGYVKGDPNLVAKNIALGTSIFGITGASPEDSKLLVYPGLQKETFTPSYGDIGIDNYMPKVSGNKVGAAVSGLIDITKYNYLLVQPYSANGNPDAIYVGFTTGTSGSYTTWTYQYRIYEIFNIVDISAVTGTWRVGVYLDTDEYPCTIQLVILTV